LFFSEIRVSDWTNQESSEFTENYNYNNNFYK